MKLHYNEVAENKILKYGALCASHMPVEIADTWNQSVIELIQDTGRRITAATEDYKRDGVPVSKPVDCSSEGECGRFPGYI